MIHWVMAMVSVGLVMRRGQARTRRRPVVLFAAMLAPAILAGGLLVGEVSGYEGGPLAEQDELAAVAGAGMAFEPVYVPAPARPDRAYEGVVPGPPEARPAAVVRAPRERVRTPVQPVERRVITPSVEPREVECPGEWEETWLWEVCREHQRQPA